MGASWKHMFGNAPPDPYGGAFKSLGEFATCVAAGRGDQRLIRNAGMSGGSGVSAGHLVPPQFVEDVFNGALALEAIRPNALVLPMAGDSLSIAGFDYLDGTAGRRAGLQLNWGTEAGTLTEQVAVARTIQFKARKANILCRVSTELAEDATAFDTRLRGAMTATVASGLDGAFVNGTGAGQPLGILRSPALITVAKETDQPADTVALANLVNMMARLSPASYRNSRWLVHPTTLGELYGLASLVAGSLLDRTVERKEDGSLSILGRPVIVTDAASTLSSAGDVILADLTQYGIGMRRDVTMEMSRDAYFTTDEIGFKLTLRLDGQPLASAATTLRDGTSTVSPFVALGERS